MIPMYVAFSDGILVGPNPRVAADAALPQAL
jgi:hypothetical protein